MKISINASIIIMHENTILYYMIILVRAPIFT